MEFIILSKGLLVAINQEQNVKNRSVFIEEATWLYLRQRRRREREIGATVTGLGAAGPAPRCAGCRWLLRGWRVRRSSPAR